ncbi:MAG: type II methionyl aminopeptidase [Candidatus Aenigmatarchaeota archaeon]
MIEYLKKSGKIAKEVYEYSKNLLKPEVSLLEIAESLENKIKDLGGEPAFPVNISINDIAAHYTPVENDKKIIKEGDVVKIDFGVHVEGYIVDIAYTVEINDNKYKNLILASKDALKSVKNILKKDIELGIIGKNIEEEIKKYKYNPIYNLSGHKIERFLLHAGINIPNYNNNSKIKLNEGIYAIEPFATNGIGYVEDFKESEIYSIIDYKPIRESSIRKFLDYLYNKYKNLPFAYRWLKNEFKDSINIKYALKYLISKGIVKNYSILKEKSGGIVSQFETTFLINNGVHDLIEFI